MSSTTTPSDDKLYMTEDLEDRLDPESLVDAAPAHMDDVEPNFYAENSLTYPILPKIVLPDPIKATVMLTFESGESRVLDGSLVSLSFGHEGWLCTVSTSATVVPSVALQVAKEPIQFARVMLPDGQYEMFTNVDCTATFSYGTASFTVTSDEARYV